MAWTSPRTWVTGETVTAAQMNTHIRDNFEALNPDDQVTAATWEPTLEATVTNPDLGDGSVTGRQWRIGPLQFVAARFAFGGGSSNGSGNFFVTLPVSASGVTAQNIAGGGQTIGEWQSRDDSAPSNNEGGSVTLRSSSTVYFNRPVGGVVNDTTPFTWTGQTNDPDVLSFQAVYPVA